MKVALRTDASSRIGSGHVMRCKTLADMLRNRGAEVRFICRDHAGNLNQLLRDAGYAVDRLPQVGDGRVPSVHGDYAAWLGVEQPVDAEQTIKALREFTPDWLVVDHYGLDAVWERLLRPHVRRLFVIDDLANRPHDCDLLLDQNWFGDVTERRYGGLVVENCQHLLGSRYALLQPLFWELRKMLPPRDGAIRRVLIFFGGVDSGNQTTKALKALSVPELSDIEACVVIGNANANESEIERLAAARPNTTLHRRLPGLAGLMMRVDLMLGAGGATTWERCCLGLPSIVVSAGDNQSGFTVALAKHGVQRYLGLAGEVKTADWTAAMRELNESPRQVQAYASAARGVTDGLGTCRVVAVMQQEPIQVGFRQAVREDELLVTEWVKDLPVDAPPSERTASEVRPKGSPARAQSEREIVIVQDGHGLPVGQIGLERQEDEILIDISVDRALCGQGAAEALLGKLWELFRLKRDDRPLIAEFLKGHLGRGVFVRLSPRPLEVSRRERAPLHITVLSDPASWINDHLHPLLRDWLGQGHAIRWIHSTKDLMAGDICFLLSCGQILRPEQLEVHRHNLVVHESELPKGRGWSPLTWQVLEGSNRIPVTLFEADAKLDNGSIYLQTWIELNGTELVDELRAQQAAATLALCRAWVEAYPAVLSQARPQEGAATSYPRRTAKHSELDPAKPLGDQMNLLRVVDNRRYPAFFDWKGKRYVISIKKDESLA